MLPYPSGTAAHGPYAELHHWRRRRPLQAHDAASTSCTRWAGTPSDCPPKTPRSKTKPSRATGPSKTSPRFKRVLRRFGFSYDWRREISTCEPEYYRWNQWFFLRMLEKGIAYPQKKPVNWCPACGTVLANEQVIDGFCWRHEDVRVEIRETRTVVLPHHAIFRPAPRRHEAARSAAGPSACSPCSATGSANRAARA